MRLLDGRKLARRILADLGRKIRRQKRKPGLAVILIGEDKASELYVSLKQKAAGAIDMDFWVLKFSARDSDQDVLRAIKELNSDPSIDGIIVQLPLPKKFRTEKIIRTVDPRKDADGFLSRSPVAPVFPSAIMRLLESGRKQLAGKQAVVIANSEIFGKAMTVALRIKKIQARYVLFSNLKSQILKLKEADILISAVGKPGLIKGRMLKRGAMVIDGGITKRGKKVLGDADFQSASRVAEYLSPVPGGVGPLTIACLLENVHNLSGKHRIK